MVTNPEREHQPEWNPMATWVRGQRREPEPQPEPEYDQQVAFDADEPAPDERVTSRSETYKRAAQAAMFAATGVLIPLDEIGKIEAEPDERAVVPPSYRQPPAIFEPSGEAYEDAAMAYVQHERDWRDRVGLPRVKKHLSPSDTTQGRRLRYARDKAARLGLNEVDVLHAIKVRPQTTRAGRLSAATPTRAENRPL